jgi:hypothetical protein
MVATTYNPKDAEERDKNPYRFAHEITPTNLKGAGQIFILVLDNWLLVSSFSILNPI